MANLYPSLEDFKYDLLMNSKSPNSHVGTHLRGITNGGPPAHSGHQKFSGPGDMGASLYPSFADGGPHHPDDAHSAAAPSSTVPVASEGAPVVAPLSGYSQAHRCQPSNSIRPVAVCKDSSGKVGLRLVSVQGGVFVALVYADSPAALAGLRFGDQVLEINDVPVAGYSMQKVHELIRRASPDELRLAARDRPFERTVTLHKDQNGLVGFIFNKRGKIVSIVRDSSAARNGLLVEHNILEINAQNVVGLEEGEIRAALDKCGDVVVLTIMPSAIYETLIKDTDPKLIRDNMDHTALAL